MKTKIIPTQAGFPQQEATEIAINYSGFLGDTTSNSHWVLSNEKGEQVADGNVHIPEEIHSKWGTDDTLVLDYILEQLGLEKQAESL